jgi:dihydrofolate reductase
LDGFVAGPNISDDNPMGEGGEQLHEWMFTDPDPIDAQVVEETKASFGAVVVGKRTFDLGLPHWEDTPFPVPTFVLTHRERPPLPAKSATFTFVTDVATAVNEAIAAAGDKDVVVMGAATGQAVMRAGLLDAVQLTVVPVVLGGGTRLFTDALRLERTRVVTSSVVTHLWLRVVS